MTVLAPQVIKNDVFPTGLIFRQVSNLLVILVFASFTFPSYGQKVTISGNITDEKTGEKLSGASVRVEGVPNGVEANKYGYYAISMGRGTQKIIVSYLGYLRLEKTVSITKDSVISFALKPLEYNLEEVVILGDDNSFSDKNGNYKIPIEQIKKIPALLSEVDVLKSLQFLPGVQQGTEGTAGLHVRGGSPDQTLILIDGVPVYNAFHLFGFFSVFNADAVAGVKVYKNELPARYGGRLSAVVDIETREGNRKQAQKSISVSPISGKFLVEGPIKKGKGAFIVAGRQTWVNLLLSTFQALGNAPNRVKYGFHDINAKFNYRLDTNNRLYVSFYRGRDAFMNTSNSANDKSSFGYNWGNYTGILRWNQIINQRLFQNTTLSFTNYKYEIRSDYKSEKQSYENKFFSDINDFQLRTDWDYFTKSNRLINAGISYTLHRFRPEVRQSSGDFVGINTDRPVTPTYVNDLQLYAQTDLKLGEKLTLNSGLHYNILAVNQTFYNSLQPRLNLNWTLSKHTNLRMAFFNSYQYLHLLTNSSLGLPTDLWVPVNEKVPPQRSNQLSVGVSYKPRSITFSVDAYVKRMVGLIEYQEGSSFLNDFSAQWYDKVAIGNGDSKGIELFIQKNTGKTQGFISYSLSWTNRVFSGINQGRPFPYKYDRRHNLSLNLNHNLTKNKRISATFTVQSGYLISLPTAQFDGVLPPGANEFTRTFFRPDYVTFYGVLGNLPNRNNFRLPLYHRLDINYQTARKVKKGERNWIFSIYNLYNRANPLFIYQQQQELRQFSLLPIIPSLSYEYKF